MSTDNRDDNCIWVSGPSLTMKGAHQPKQFVVYDIPKRATFRDWRKMSGSWEVHGSALVSVKYVEADSKQAIRQQFENEASSGVNAEMNAKLVVADVIPGAKASLAANVKSQRRQLQTSQEDASFSHRAIVLISQTSGGLITMPSIDVRIEICLDYENGRKLLPFTIVSHPQSLLFAFVVLAVVAVVWALWSFSRKDLKWWQHMIKGIGNFFELTGKALANLFEEAAML